MEHLHVDLVLNSVRDAVCYMYRVYKFCNRAIKIISGENIIHSASVNKILKEFLRSSLKELAVEAK